MKRKLDCLSFDTKSLTPSAKKLKIDENSGITSNNSITNNDETANIFRILLNTISCILLPYVGSITMNAIIKCNFLNKQEWKRILPQKYRLKQYLNKDDISDRLQFDVMDKSNKNTNCNVDTYASIYPHDYPRYQVPIFVPVQPPIDPFSVINVKITVDTSDQNMDSYHMLVKETLDSRFETKYYVDDQQFQNDAEVQKYKLILKNPQNYVDLINFKECNEDLIKISLLYLSSWNNTQVDNKHFDSDDLIKFLSRGLIEKDMSKNVQDIGQHIVNDINDIITWDPRQSLKNTEDMEYIHIDKTHLINNRKNPQDYNVSYVLLSDYINIDKWYILNRTHRDKIFPIFRGRGNNIKTTYSYQEIYYGYLSHKKIIVSENREILEISLIKYQLDIDKIDVDGIIFQTDQENATLEITPAYFDCDI